jgi:hypothetical protein
MTPVRGNEVEKSFKKGFLPSFCRNAASNLADSNDFAHFFQLFFRKRRNEVKTPEYLGFFHLEEKIKGDNRLLILST